MKTAIQKRLCPRGRARAEVTPGACFDRIVPHSSFLSKKDREELGSRGTK